MLETFEHVQVQKREFSTFMIMITFMKMRES